MEKTVLVAIDGSPSSSNSLEYLARLFGGNAGLKVHLLAVVATASGGKDWMFDVDPHRTATAASSKGSQQASRHLKEARERLVRAGLADERIQTQVKVATGGISATIREEAERGSYDSLVIGRRGLGAMGNMFFGSTSGDLVDKCHRIPLWIVDGNISSSRFLLAVHGHPASLMAADHLGFILKGHPEAEVLLYHSDSVFGKQQPAKAEEFHAQWGKAWCDQYLDLENFLFYAHAQLLNESGLSRSRVRQLPMQMHLDVGADLLRQAKQHNCGTIVIGRRRRDSTSGQIRGVSDKTVKGAQNVAIWLAG
jgi:nucleotide-binding universal stress UspA family protein